MRELRAAGFDMTQVCPHVWRWRNNRWRLVLSLADGCATVDIHRRYGPASADALIGQFFPDDVWQIHALLSALGVLPSPTERAA
jgi:hypothetical protein